MKYGLHGSLKATEGNGDELENVLIEASQLVSKLKGCRLYAVSRDLDNDDLVWVTEIWDTRADHANSLKDANVLALIGRAMPLIDMTHRQRQELDVVGGHGV